MERWRDVPGYEDIYQVSDQGRVRRIAPGKSTHPGYILKTSRRGGYLRVGLTWNALRRSFSVHRLVLSAFVGHPQPQQECNHKNGDKADNRLANLEWITRSKNLIHSFQVLGRPVRDQDGEDNFSAKLTEGDVRAIRRLYATGNYTQDALGRAFGITQSKISLIVRRLSWKHVQDE